MNSMQRRTHRSSCHQWVGLFVFGTAAFTLSAAAAVAASLHNSHLSVSFNPQNGSYEIRVAGSESPVLASRFGAELNHHWVSSSDYPRHEEAQSTFQDPLGAGQQDTITFSGLSSQPDLVCTLRLYNDLPYGTVGVNVVNHTAQAVSVEAIRDVDAIGDPRVNLGGPESSDRVMLEGFTEDPTIKIGGLDQAPDGTYSGVGTGLIYNLESHRSLLLAALTARRFMTAMHLKVRQSPGGGAAIDSFTADSTGTTEAVLKRDEIRPEQQVELSLPVEPGQDLSSEQVMFTAGPDYHAQLERYGAAVRRLHHARVSSMAPIGWWSWTAFYSSITQDEVLANAKWMAANLKSLGFDYCHVDEGYGNARGDYIDFNKKQFPDGMESLGRKVAALGLKFAVWTAPFEVGERAWVYQNHQDWLVRDAEGHPIQINYGSRRHQDPLYVLDTTNPDAQQYLRKTYKVITRDWGVRYIKLDFMDSSAVEGYYHRPHTTALEAERIGLQIIRDAVGQNVLLDKDGSPMLTPVGLVDEGRIAPDTGHSFRASRDADPNIAARYYMNRTFYISDPDAFSVSTEVAPQEGWHRSRQPLTLNEAQVQVALAAVSGGMYEIGDDMTKLDATPDRVALIKNPELLKMVKLGRAAVPVDLMTFSAEDEMPSIYFLKEDGRQSMIAIFNFTEQPRSHTLDLSTLGLAQGRPYKGYDALNADAPVALEGSSLEINDQAPHSVKLIKIVDTSASATAR
ncbi:MAG TPA: glycoside hydrolase family 36 protein [Terriglobia bacterium]|nr:glycoside hydrolase family 36 protein [Terriglobia bacterium]